MQRPDTPSQINSASRSLTHMTEFNDIMSQACHGQPTDPSPHDKNVTLCLMDFTTIPQLSTPIHHGVQDVEYSDRHLSCCVKGIFHAVTGHQSVSVADHLFLCHKASCYVQVKLAESYLSEENHPESCCYAHVSASLSPPTPHQRRRSGAPHWLATESVIGRML